MTNYDGLFNKEYFGNRLNENHFFDKKIYFRIIENGTILPSKFIDGVSFGFGGIVDEKWNFIKNSVVSKGLEGPYTPNEDIAYEDSTAIYLGMLVGVWGHSITDNLKHAWFFNSEVYNRHFKNCPIAYIPWEGGGIVHNLAKLMTILEINPDKLYPVTKPVKFRNIIIPDESFFDESGKKFFTDEYRQTIDRIRSFAKKNLSPTANKKFYLFHGSNRIGEERLANYFHSKGYDIVTPGLLPLEEQLNIFANCEELASTVGSISHNIIFLRDNANVILIQRKGSYLNDYQQALNQVHDINVFYIDSALSIFQSVSEGPYCYIVSENLRKHFGDEITEKYTEEDFAAFLAYFRVAKSQGLVENPNEMEYLKTILPEFIAQLKTHEDLMQKFGIVVK